MRYPYYLCLHNIEFLANNVNTFIPTGALSTIIYIAPIVRIEVNNVAGQFFEPVRVVRAVDNLKLVPEKERKRRSPGRFHKILFTLRSDLSPIWLTHSCSRSRMDHYIFRTNRTEVHAGKYIGRSSAYRRCSGDGWRVGRGIAACRLLSWTQGGITDYSLSRPICQAAWTTRSQALYCKIKWLACGARPSVYIVHRAAHFQAPGPA